MSCACSLLYQAPQDVGFVVGVQMLFLLGLTFLRIDWLFPPPHGRQVAEMVLLDCIAESPFTKVRWISLSCLHKAV